MGDILQGYDVSDATWFYLSLLLVIAVFFRFGRVWSLRNLDLILLLSISPGLLLVSQHASVGYVWLFVITALLLLRLFCDSLLERRPRLEQNLNMPGMAFMCASALAFLMTSVVTKPLPPMAIETIERGEDMLDLHDTSAMREQSPTGPVSKIIAAPLAAVTEAVTPTQQAVGWKLVAARTMAILAHIAVISALLLLGFRHFGDLQIGLAMATLYLLLPCTAYDVAEINHVLPAALILWAFVSYRRPWVAGSLMGLACGTLYYPVFLLPLWAAFYGRRGALRFCLALCIVAAVLLGSFALTSADVNSFLRQTFGWIDWGNGLKFRSGETTGFWSEHDPAYGIPVFVAYLVMLVVLTVWPRKKNLEHLMAHSTALVVGTQFWYPQQGGVYLLWYLPLLLMVVFRPRLAQLLPPGSEPVERSSRRATPVKRTEAATSAATTGSRLFR
jgi:hypothetical protein